MCWVLHVVVKFPSLQYGAYKFNNMGKILLSAIKPSSDDITIGNYLGAVKQWVELQEKYRVILFLADGHAITVPQEPAKLSKNTLKLAKILLACGIDPKKTLLFVQSHVPAHFELAWILNTLTPVGELERMVQFKEKSVESGVLAGLLNYPVLQAADILLYQTDVVPVGEDQLQHIELTRSLAEKFNNRFGQTFKIPQPLLHKETGRIMGLNDPKEKMSKSSPASHNYITLLESPQEIRRKIKIAVTDSGKEVRYDKESKPAISNLMAIYSGFSGLSYSEIEKKYKGKFYAEFKADLAEIVVRELSLIQKKYNSLPKKDTLRILKKGAETAKKIANEALKEVKDKMGFVDVQ